MPISKSLTAIVFGTLLAAGCNNGGESTDTPTAGEAILADDTSSSVANRLVTGASSADNTTHWLCGLSNTTKTVDNYVLSFWSDKSGVAGKESMSWFPVDDDSISISWGANQITLNNFLFTDNNANTSFSATSSKNDRLDCELSGPKPIQGNALLDFAPIADIRIVNSRTDQSDVWSCLSADQNGAETERNFAFWGDGFGTSDKGHFSWYFNDDENIIVSYENEVRELRSLRFASESDRPSSFTALDRQNTLNCTR